MCVCEYGYLWIWVQWVECVDVDAICLCVEERFGCVWMMGEVWVGVNGGRDVGVWMMGERCGCNVVLSVLCKETIMCVLCTSSAVDVQWLCPMET